MSNGLGIDYARRSTIGYHRRIINDQGKDDMNLRKC